MGEMDPLEDIRANGGRDEQKSIASWVGLLLERRTLSPRTQWRRCRVMWQDSVELLWMIVCIMGEPNLLASATFFECQFSSQKLPVANFVVQWNREELEVSTERGAARQV